MRGYVWLFPRRGRARERRRHAYARARPVGRGHRGGATARAPSATAFDLADGARGWPAWRYRARRARIAAPHVLCVGDAAGIDALTGEGIAVGLEEGPIAARAVAGALTSGDFAFGRYARDVRRAVVGRELALDGRLAAMLYARGAFGLWLSLIMFDERMQQLYAARVSGSEVLADRKGELLAALGRHALHARSRMRALATT